MHTKYIANLVENLYYICIVYIKYTYVFFHHIFFFAYVVISNP